MVDRTISTTGSNTFLIKRQWWLLPVMLWTAIVAWSLSGNIVSIREHNLNIAKTSAENIFRIIQLARYWNARHGGVYVPVSEHATPNPYLEIDNRDVETLDGLKMTMINPAYMTRQLTELLSASSPVSFRITSLHPIRPKNEPDPWEQRALERFEQNEQEFFERMEVGNEQIFRYMAPLLVKKPCMKCHEKQGYQVGDIRGGISVTLNADFIFDNQGRRIAHEWIKHGLAYVLVIGMMLWFFQKLRAQWLDLLTIEHQQEQIIEERTRELRELVTHDALTGLYNRKALDDFLKSKSREPSVIATKWRYW